jgi:aryl-alcohol dehydrogenase-like predicted oxidoreductase
MFNLRLSEEQYEALQQMAREHHLPMSTMARAWLLDRLDHERRAS